MNPAAQAAALEASIGDDLGGFGRSITLTVEFDTAERRDSVRARLKEMAKKRGVKPGVLLKEAVTLLFRSKTSTTRALWVPTWGGCAHRSEQRRDRARSEPVDVSRRTASSPRADARWQRCADAMWPRASAPGRGRSQLLPPSGVVRALQTRAATASRRAAPGGPSRPTTETARRAGRPTRRWPISNFR